VGNGRGGDGAKGENRGDEVNTREDERCIANADLRKEEKDGDENPEKGTERVGGVEPGG